MPAKYVKPKQGVCDADARHNNVEPITANDPSSSLLLVQRNEVIDYFRQRGISLPSSHILNNPRVVHLTDAGKWPISKATGTIIADNLNRRNAIMIESYGVKQEGENACMRCRGILNPARPPHLIFSTGCYKANRLAGGSCGNCAAGGEQSRCSLRNGAPLPPALSNPAPPRPDEAYGTRRSSRALNQEPAYTANQLPALRVNKDEQASTQVRHLYLDHRIQHHSDNMSSSSTPKAQSGAQRKFCYMRTDPRINTDFEDLQLTPKPSHNAEPSSQDSKSMKTGAKNNRFPFGDIPLSEVTESDTGASSSSEYEVTAFSSAESEVTLEESMDLDSDDFFVSSKPKPKASPRKRVPRTPTSVKPKLLPSPSKVNPRTPTRVAKKSLRAKTPISTPRKKALVASALTTPSLEPLNTQVHESPGSIVAPVISSAKTVDSFDDLPIFGVRYSRPSNSTKLTVAKANGLATIPNEYDRPCRDGGSVEGLDGQDRGGIASPRKDIMSPSKKRIRDIEKDEKDTKRSKVIKLKLNLK